MKIKADILNIFVLFSIVIVSMSGCSSNTGNGIINSDQLSKMMHKNDDINQFIDRNSDEAVMHNGVVVYRDRSDRTTPMGYKETNIAPSTGRVKFGPQDPSVCAPHQVNIKDNNN